MKQWYGHLAVMMLVLLVLGCSEKMTEEQLRTKALDFENKEQWAEATKMYERLLKAYPKSLKADETMYRLGVIYANNLKDFGKSVASYQRLIKEYSNSNYVVQSSFMIGFRYANDIKDLDKARACYEDFIKKWPNHELAPSVRWELEHLGQDISEIDLPMGNADSASDSPKN